MKVLVLRGGEAPAAAGRGEPTGRPASSRSHGTLAVSADGEHWALLNMSPGVARQLETDPRLQAHAGLREGDVRAVVLTDAQLDHGAGLLGLRDGAAIDLYATPAVFEDLTSTLPVLPVLRHYCPVHWRVIPVAGEADTASFQVQGMPLMEFTAVATGPVAPRHSPRHGSPVVGDSVALAVHDRGNGARLFCATGLQPLAGSEAAWMREADAIVVSADALGANDSHILPWLEELAALPARRKLLLCPLRERHHSPHQREVQRQAEAQGIEWAYDGLEFEL